MRKKIELMGHRGARGMRPENTLPSFEFALDHGVDSIETDVLLTADKVAVLCHEPILSEKLCRRIRRDGPAPKDKPRLSQLTLDQLRGYRADGNLDPARFPDQRPIVTPLAEMLAEDNGVDPFCIPTVADLFALVRAYTGLEGKKAGKTAKQQRHARKIILDFELKRVPFEPELVGDDFNGDGPGLMEKLLIDAIRQADMLAQCRVRSFDHRALAGIKKLQPRIATAILISHTAPVSLVELTATVGAELYCPDYRFVDQHLIRVAHSQGLRIIPWTVNEPAVWDKLIAWGVDGIATDYPNRFAR